ncbi:molecular chaperone [Salmonella enterica]|nr:molecular chaperone [Salmonella enterica]
MKKLQAITLCLLFFAFQSLAGVSLGGTRLIYEGNKKETSIIVFSNEEDRYPYLIQSFVDAAGEKGDKPDASRSPFIVTPPLFRLEPGKENVLRVVRVSGELPDDRESVFWLNVKAIPGTEKNRQDTNILKLSLKNRIKLFYRPDSLVKKQDSEIFSGVRFSRSGSALIVTNPTPYFISFSTLRVDGKKIDTDFVMVPPKGESRYLLPPSVKGSAVEWAFITDYGSASVLYKGVVEK